MNPQTNGTWTPDDLTLLETTLSKVPPHHLLEGPFAQICREEILSRENRHYTTIAGVYQPLEGILRLYNAAFRNDTVSNGAILSPFELTLLTLVGHVVFEREEVKIHWATHFYPRFDQGDGVSYNVKIVDLEKLHDEVTFQANRFILNPEHVSLDRSFALLYALFILKPEWVVTSYPNAALFFMNTLFHSWPNAMNLSSNLSSEPKTRLTV